MFARCRSTDEVTGDILAAMATSAWRIVFGCGALVIVLAVGSAIVLRGWELASSVATVFGALGMACGLMKGALRPVKTKTSLTSNDEITQSDIEAGCHVIGKSDTGSPSRDRIRQNRIKADGDVIGKRSEAPDED